MSHREESQARTWDTLVTEKVLEQVVARCRDLPGMTFRTLRNRLSKLNEAFIF